MHKLKKVAAVAAMVSGLGLVGGGVASANGGHDYDDPYPADVAINNLQIVKCDQDYKGGGGLLEAPPSVAAGATETENIGNFCTVIGSVDD